VSAVIDVLAWPRKSQAVWTETLPSASMAEVTECRMKAATAWVFRFGARDAAWNHVSVY
jgi:hypothetical protein